MRTKNYILKKIFPVQLVLIIVLSIILNIITNINVVQAAKYTQYSKTGIEEFPESYQSYLKKLSDLYPNWKFTAFYTGITWDEFMKNESSLGGSSYTHGKNTVIKTANPLWLDSCGTVKSGYACASPEIIAYYADPRNFLTESGVFQFLEMSYNSEAHDTAGVQSIIKGTFMDTSITFKVGEEEKTMTYAEIIMEAAKETKISPYSIAIKIIQEVGRQGSNSVSGTYEGYEGYYNFFNIGAYDTGNAIANGLEYAKQRGWNNQYIAIIQGAEYLSNSYIKVGQNTAYFYKFDVVDDSSNSVFWHQYMTNIEDPSSQAKNLYNTYAKNNLLDISLNFIIPVYSDMPNVCNLPGTIDQTLNTSYYVNGTGVSLRSEPTTDSARITTLTKDEVVKVIDFNVGSANGYNWAQIEQSNGTKGYVANKYITPCNAKVESSIARIDGEYIITVPNTKLIDLAKEVEVTSFEINDANGKEIADTNQIAQTTNVLHDKATNKYYKIAVLGDVNGDETVDSGDLLVLKKHLLETSIIADESKKKAMDANRDGAIDSGDLLVIKKYLLGTRELSL